MQTLMHIPRSGFTIAIRKYQLPYGGLSFWLMKTKQSIQKYFFDPLLSALGKFDLFTTFVFNKQESVIFVYHVGY
jgi:hypothetical protein